MFDHYDLITAAQAARKKVAVFAWNVNETKPN